MINCKYCGVYQETIKPTCPSCGAPMQVEEKKTSKKTEAQILAEKIARICDHHMSRDFKDGTSIPPKRWMRSTSHFLCSQLERRSSFIAIPPLLEPGNTAL